MAKRATSIVRVRASHSRKTKKRLAVKKERLSALAQKRGRKGSK